MKFAIVNGKKETPIPNSKGICQFCNEEVISKCGNIKIWHWAHSPKKDCDKWWENETVWHRKWKNYFNIENQEIIHFADNGEKHIADVKTNNGTVIELQNSPISMDEMKSREDFYQNMIWIVNGEAFIKRFVILHPLPDPNIEEMKDNRIMFTGNKKHYPAYYKKSENEEGARTVLIHSFDDIVALYKKSYAGHHLFCWNNPRKNWYHSKVPVYFDFGDNCLYHLTKYGDSKPLTVQIISKKNIVENYNGEYQTEGDPQILNATFMEGKGNYNFYS